MILYKKGVDTGNVSGPCWHAIRSFDRILRWYAHDIDTIVTEINATGGHMNGSKHYSGAAVDFRDRHIRDKPWINRFIDSLRRELVPAGFQVIQESDHVHVEFDPPRAD